MKSTVPMLQVAFNLNGVLPLILEHSKLSDTVI